MLAEQRPPGQGSRREISARDEEWVSEGDEMEGVEETGDEDEGDEDEEMEEEWVGERRVRGGTKSI